MRLDNFIISMCIKGDRYIRIRRMGDEITLREGHSTLIPACIADYDVIPLYGGAQLLDACIDNWSNTVLSID